MPLNFIDDMKMGVIQDMVSEAVGAGIERHLETVDFNDPARPKTCLEVDFPILLINQIAQIEGNAGKPIYQMSKWWARRRSSVFRSILIAAATKAPEDDSEAAKLVWNSYYGNHKKNKHFADLKVADIFMGGGTTVVEGARLGMQMYGNDLNPIAWLVVKNELSHADLEEVKKLFDYIEKEVKSQIMPFYVSEGPNGEKGNWFEIETGKLMSDTFDPISLSPEDRKQYRYEGPEIIYTFWAKHGPCIVPGCNHRTPLINNPVIAVKTLSVKSWPNQKCLNCDGIFDVEAQEVRMSPEALFIVAETERPFTILESSGEFKCPHCGKQNLKKLVKPKTKNVELSLIIHPYWMNGSPGKDQLGQLGGTVTSSYEETLRWNEFRQKNLQLIEVRGILPKEIVLPGINGKFSTEKGTIPKRSTFTCQEETCGKEQDVMAAIRESKKTSPVSQYALQCYSPKRSKNGAVYNGRYFKAPSVHDVKRYNAVIEEWAQRSKNDLADYWPKSELPFGFMTHIANGDLQKNYGYTHWYTMFNPRQLLVHALFLKTIDNAYGYSEESKEIALGAFEQFLAYENMFCFWHRSHDHFAPHLSNNNFHPKNTSIEVGPFSSVGYGPWRSVRGPIIEALNWKNMPWELVPTQFLSEQHSELKGKFSGKSEKVFPNDTVNIKTNLTCGSSTDLKTIPNLSHDLVITDPPFGGLLHYSELSDFFYVWLRLVLKKKYPEYYGSEHSPKKLEAVANRARNPDDADDFYKRLLTQCWREAFRILKPAGILAFTFHHSEDEPWVDVLESLFESGFYLEATYPIRSDETKGKGEFGSKTIEYDIIHVCRKRIDEPTKISWPRLRRQILSDVRQLQQLLEHHQQEGLPQADIEVIKRGKALEYFSRHYGKVYVEEGREFSVKEALVGINQILDDQTESDGVKAPTNAEPLTRQFLRIFALQESVPRDQIQKYLRGSGIGPSDFISYNWCKEINRSKIFQWYSPLEFVQNRNSFRGVKKDLDQALVLIGSCYPESGINANRLMRGDDFKPHPALGELLDWLSKNGPDNIFRNASIVAKQLFNTWAAENQSIITEQLSIFDLIQS